METAETEELDCQVWVAIATLLFWGEVRRAASCQSNMQQNISSLAKLYPASKLLMLACARVQGFVAFELRGSMSVVPADDDGPAGASEVLNVTLPPRGQLAKRWEENTLLRQQLRDERQLLSWPSKVTIGVASQPALILNRVAIQILVDEWSNVCSKPKSIPIDWVRDEACFRKNT